MTLKRILGIVICIAGLVLIFISNYIKQQVEEGNIKIANAENKVSQGQSLFGLNPVTKTIGQKAIFDPAQAKISAGKDEVAQYTILAHRLMIGGILLFIVGVGVIIIPVGRNKGA